MKKPGAAPVIGSDVRPMVQGQERRAAGAQSRVIAALVDRLEADLVAIERKRAVEVANGEFDRADPQRRPVGESRTGRGGDLVHHGIHIVDIVSAARRRNGASGPVRAAGAGQASELRRKRPLCYTAHILRFASALVRPPMSVDAETVRRIAHLARIAVADEEVEHLRGELNAILAFVEQLSEVDVSAVEPMTSVTPIAMKKRQDVVADGDIADAVVQNAPAREDHYFVVPKVVE